MRLSYLLVVVLAATAFAAGCGGDDTAAQGTTTDTATVQDTTETENVETATTGETDTVETTTGATTSEEASGDAAKGEQVFASAGCGGCHTLAAAGSSGTIGPNLDDASPSFDKVIERVTNGQGAMPSFADTLSAQEIQDVAAFVSGATRD